MAASLRHRIATCVVRSMPDVNPFMRRVDSRTSLALRTPIDTSQPAEQLVRTRPNLVHQLSLMNAGEGCPPLRPAEAGR
jgi:hypothetical protein